MNLKELYEKLSFGELSNLSLGTEGDGAVLEGKKPMVCMQINEALLRLYGRFILKEKDVLVEQVDHITNYHLKEKFTASRAPQPGAPYPYIKDLVGEPFIEDVLKILSVWQAGGIELPLNDIEHTWSVFTPQAQDILQVPNPRTGVSMSIAYQAKHPKLIWNREKSIIELPEILHGALTALVGGLVYGNMNTQEAMAKSQMCMGMYEAICQEAIDRDLVNTSISSANTRFRKRGWK